MRTLIELLKMAGFRCPEYIWPEMAEWGAKHRCSRWRWHSEAHRNPHGDSWQGARR